MGLVEQARKDLKEIFRLVLTQPDSGDYFLVVVCGLQELLLGSREQAQ